MEVTKKFVQVDSFRGKFNEKDWIEEVLNAGHNQQQNIPGGSTKRNSVLTPIDPKQPIRTLESTVEALIKMKRKVQRKIEDLEDMEQASLPSAKLIVADINSTFDSVQQGFSNLNSQITSVGSTAVKIGEQLETIDKQRTRALEAKELMAYFLEFNRGDASRLDEFRRNESEYDAVIIAKRMNAISKEVGSPEMETARSNIERYCEEIETSLLAAFDSAMRMKNISKMKEVAKTLFDFNGGNSCFRTFINQNQFFINSQVVEFQHVFTLSTLLEENSSGIPNADPNLTEFYSQIRKTIKEEWEIIYAVFPNASFVMQQFVQRIFAQSVQSQLENLLQQAENHSLIVYLQVLAASHRATQNLVSDIHKFDEDLIAPLVGSPILTVLLDRCFEDLFVLYTEGDRYVDSEVKLYSEIKLHAMINFETFTANRHKTLLRKGTKTAVVPVNSATTQAIISPSTKEPISSIALANMANVISSIVGDSGPSTNPDLSPDENGFVSVDTMVKLVKPHIHSVNRCKQLVPQHLLPSRTAKLLKVLLAVIPEYILISLTMAKEDFFAKHEPDFQYLQLIKEVVRIMRLIQTHFQTTILPCISGSPSLHRELVAYKNELMGQVEEACSSLILQCVDSVSKSITATLLKQKKTDYKPKEESIDIESTQTCEKICDFLQGVIQEVNSHLDSENLSTFSMEVGSLFHGLLLEHLKKFVFTPSGAAVLLKDLTRYLETVQAFSSRELNERFETLREIGNLYMVKPEVLKSVINEGALGRIDLSLIHPYIVRRSDWSDLKNLEREIFDQTLSPVSFPSKEKSSGRGALNFDQ